VADSADLMCIDHEFGLTLGWFWNTGSPRYIFTPDGKPSSRSPTLCRALGRMLAEHAGHNVRLLGEQSPEWDELDLDTLVVVGGDRTLGHDPSIEQYAEGAPALAHATGLIHLVCESDRTVLPLGAVRSAAADDLNRALWKTLAEHIYHDVTVVKDSTERDWSGYTTIGVDVSLSTFVHNWPG
jgi:hypothetical protein